MNSLLINTNTSAIAQLTNYTTGVATANSSIVTSSSATWNKKIGNVVIVELRDIVFNGSGSNRLMFSNLPVLISRVDTVISNGSVHSDIGIMNDIIMAKYNASNTGSKAMNGSLVYFTES